MLAPPLPLLSAPLLDWACWYAALGWPVIAMHTPGPQGCSCRDGATCRTPGKHPRTAHGRNDASTNPQTLAEWWQRWPDANIAIKTDGLFVLDIDHRHQGHQSLYALEQQYGRLPDGPRALSGSGGDHYFFALPADGIAVYSSDGLVESGIDIKGFQGNINVAPSLHASGQRYVWDDLFSPDAFALTPPPQWLVDLARQVRPTSVQRYEAGVSIPEGARYHYLIGVASRSRYNGFSESQIYESLCIANQNCQPPEEERELHKYAHWAARKDMADPYTLNPAILQVSHKPIPTTEPAPDHEPLTADDTHAQWGTPRPPLLFTDVADIWSKAYEAPKWLIEDLIPEGLTYLVGSQKSGKTYLSYSLALTLATSVLTHNLWLDFYPVLLDGPVVFLSLEDTENLFWYRIHQLMPYLQSFPKDRFFFRYDPAAPSLGEGLADHLYTDIIKVYQPALLVIDPISYVSGFTSKTKYTADVYTEFRRAMLPVRAMAAESHLCLLGSEHRRKQSADDVDIFETQQGSNAKGAVADATLVIVREADDLTMRARIRNAGEQTITITFKFDEKRLVTLTYKGAHEGHLNPGNFSAMTMKILEALSGLKQPMSMPELLAATNIPDSRQARQAIFQVLYRAVRSGTVQKTNRGMYVWSGGN